MCPRGVRSLSGGCEANSYHLTMRTDYAAHESAYQRLRRSGRPGWDEAHDAARSLAILDSMLAWPGVPAPGRLIELGAGAGDACLHLARRGWRTHGVEISPTAVEWAREKAAAEAARRRSTLVVSWTFPSCLPGRPMSCSMDTACIASSARTGPCSLRRRCGCCGPAASCVFAPCVAKCQPDGLLAAGTPCRAAS